MVLQHDQTLADLMAVFPHAGTLEWIGLSPGYRQPIVIVPHGKLLAEHGLEGDRRAARKGSKRQITLLQQEHLPAIAAFCRTAILPDQLRRNLVISGINLLALHDRRFRIGPALLEGTGHCHPCSRMEENLGPGGYNAVRGYGGITARVIEGAIIRVGDPVTAA